MRHTEYNEVGTMTYQRIWEDDVCGWCRWDYVTVSTFLKDLMDMQVWCVVEFGTYMRATHITVRVWVVWDYEALPCQITNNLNTRYND